MLVDAQGNPTGPSLENRLDMQEGALGQLYQIARQIDAKINASNMQAIEIGILVEFLISKGEFSMEEITQFRATRIEEIQQMHREAMEKQQADKQASVNLDE